ncbi:MAG: HD domain-containing protein [Sterolibacterium sp.]|nr:HD domain-containing protein [Sterolibacterium sp.]MBP9799566.1 HD domain-containing protein [Sterolibacterium sp.]
MTERPQDTSQYPHADLLAPLNGSDPLDQRLTAIHEALYTMSGCVDRISVASYDPATDLLKTFLASSPGRNDLVRYEARLTDTPSLAEILHTGRPRIIDDLSLSRRSNSVHSRIIADDGYRLSYTTPMYLNGACWGFIFFDSRNPGPLPEATLNLFDVFAHMISAVVTAEMMSIRTLAAAIKTAHDMVHFRDPETGGHIDRMSRYARLIAQHLAATGAAALDDETIERIFQFAPLHDIGKLAIPDRILLKPGRLSAEEKEEMKLHTLRGQQMIEDIVQNFGLSHLSHLDLLKNIAESHHEAMDGSGYPHGLRGEEIPLEARIIAVADVFDALTSQRPYKPSWSNEEAFAWLRQLSRSKFDKDCVDALIFNAIKVRQIQQQFKDDPHDAVTGAPVSSDDRPPSPIP